MNKSSNVEKLLIVILVILGLAVFAGICWGDSNCSSVDVKEEKDTTTLISLTNPFDTILFNPETNCAEWVKWKITVDRLKKKNKVKRSDYPFTPDDTPLLQDKITTYDYSKSGYDRGHLSPAADNEHSKTAMKDCMEMTNIIPQTPELNRGPWKTLEESCRKWALSYNSTVYIAAGPVFSDTAEVRFVGRVQVPDRCFKVILIQKPMIARGWIMDNSRKPESDYQAYRVSVDSVEALTGYDFFSWLPDSIENKIEKSSYEKE